MTTTTEFVPIVLNGDDLTTSFPLGLSGRNLTDPSLIKVTRIFPDLQSDPDLPMERAERLQPPADFLIIGEPVNGYTLELINPLPSAERLIVDRQEPSLSPNRLRDGARFPAADTEGNLNRLARAGQDAGRMAGLAVRLSPIDAEIDAELPPLPEAPMFVVVERGARPRMVSAANVERLASETDALTRLADPDVIDAVRIMATPSAQGNLQILVDDRDTVTSVAQAIGQVRIVADASVRALMAQATDPANLATYEALNLNRITYERVAGIEDQVSQLAADTTRAAVNVLGQPAMVSVLTRIDARRTAIDNLDVRRTQIETLALPGTLAKIDAVTDPVTLASINDVNAQRTQIMTVANIADRVTALTQATALTGIVELTKPETMTDLRTVTQSVDSVRRVGTNISAVKMVSDNVEDIVFTPTAIANAMRGADAIIEDKRLQVVLRNADVITDRRSESAVAPVVIDKMEGRVLTSVDDRFAVNIYDKGHAA